MFHEEFRERPVVESLVHHAAAVHQQSAVDGRVVGVANGGKLRDGLPRAAVGGEQRRVGELKSFALVCQMPRVQNRPKPDLAT